ncbi:STAS domain-containing protein [Sulfuriflexus mobilis]|uniref:STAS domain-containing protein n=1 Tax=Sulfuriflexus mobilis TaxID=1811807 RepID=UPI000F8277B8|nr:STAS domain-containing protein [Sulfuriflexus mobilis]
MPVTSSKSSDGNTVTIKTSEKFDYSSHTDFREAYDDESNANVSFVIDMRNTDYMDSSALGMLLLLREHVGNDRGRIKIVNCNNEIKNIMEISSFQKLFDLE